MYERNCWCYMLKLKLTMVLSISFFFSVLRYMNVLWIWNKAKHSLLVFIFILQKQRLQIQTFGTVFERSSTLYSLNKYVGFTWLSSSSVTLGFNVFLFVHSNWTGFLLSYHHLKSRLFHLKRYEVHAWGNSKEIVELNEKIHPGQACTYTIPKLLLV